MGKRGRHPVAASHIFNAPNHGRRIRKDMVGGQFRNMSEIRCSRCSAVGSIMMKMVLPEQVIAKKFAQKGWLLDPDICPDCQITTTTTTENDMTTNTKEAVPSTAAIRAQARMMRLISEHFDEDAGEYLNGYSDQKISDEVGIALASVQNFRREGFGELKTPDELSSLRDDVVLFEMQVEEMRKSLDNTINEGLAKLAKEHKALAAKVEELARKVTR